MPYSLEPDEPTRPALPAQPVTPDMRTGGYTGPTPSGPGFAGPIPGGRPPAPQPAATGFGGPSVAFPTPSPAAPPVSGPIAAPPVGGDPTGLGISEEDRNAILEDMRSSPDPEVYRQRFEQLMEQRNLMGTPQSVDDRGYQVLSGDQEKYFNKWFREAMAFGKQPKEFGGLGYTEGQARMMVVAEARKRWPGVSPSTWASFLPTGELSAEELGQVKLGENQPAIEFGPKRSNNLDPSRIGEILTFKRFKHANQAATNYKQKYGGAANSAGFAKYVIEARVGKNLAGLESFQAARDAAKNQVAQLNAQRKQIETGALQGDADAVEQQLANAQAELAKLEAQGVGAPSVDDIRKEATDWFTQNADTFSVAAALNNLY